METASEVIKYLLAGADAVMTTSALLRHGPGYLRTLMADLEIWLSARGFASVAVVKGLMKRSPRQAETEEQERSDYVWSLLGYQGPYSLR